MVSGTKDRILLYLYGIYLMAFAIYFFFFFLSLPVWSKRETITIESKNQ